MLHPASQPVAGVPVRQRTKTSMNKAPPETVAALSRRAEACRVQAPLVVVAVVRLKAAPVAAVLLRNRVAVTTASISLNANAPPSKAAVLEVKMDSTAARVPKVLAMAPPEPPFRASLGSEEPTATMGNEKKGKKQANNPRRW